LVVVMVAVGCQQAFGLGAWLLVEVFMGQLKGELVGLPKGI
jgi:hypothetical protein